MDLSLSWASISCPPSRTSEHLTEPKGSVLRSHGPSSVRSIQLLSPHHIHDPFLAFPPISCMHSSSPHSCHMACQSNPSLLDHSVWHRVCILMQPPVTSSVRSPNIHLTSLISNTLSPCSALNVTDQVLSGSSITTVWPILELWTGDNLQTWGVAAYIQNKQLRTANDS
jgi:hypothetical protein